MPNRCSFCHGELEILAADLADSRKNLPSSTSMALHKPPKFKTYRYQAPAEILHIPTMPETGLGLTAGPTIRHDQEMFFER